MMVYECVLCISTIKTYNIGYIYTVYIIIIIYYNYIYITNTTSTPSHRCLNPKGLLNGTTYIH